MKATLAALCVLFFSCGAGRHAGATYPHPLHIVVIGDSVAHGAGDETGGGIEAALERELSALHIDAAPVANLGINGARTTDILRVFRRDPRIAEADAIIVSIGGNDLYGDTLARVRSLLWPQHATRVVMARVHAVVTQIHGLNPSARVFLLGLYNPYQRQTFLDAFINVWDSVLIGGFATDRRVTVIRIADLLREEARISPIDHFHPSAAGYALIAARIAPAL